MGPTEVDYRSEKMDSTEGLGRARQRWDRFHSARDPHFLDLLKDTQSDLDTLPDEVRDEMAGAVAERSELVGFWIAWQLAGGFENLERGGWNRSTIYRKLRRFRSVFGVHPDTARFSWLKVRHEQAWTDELVRLLHLRFPDAFDPSTDFEPEEEAQEDQEPDWVLRGLSRDPTEDEAEYQALLRDAEPEE
jgi:hypothetical protein